MPQSDSATRHFLTTSGQKVAAVKATDLSRLRSELISDFAISALQISEMAAFSMAMVVRYALGLTAEGGQVGVIVADCLPGWVALATARHLVNNGTLVTIFEQQSASANSSVYQSLKAAATKSSVDFHPHHDGASLKDLISSLDNFHNLIVGCVNIDAKSQDSHDLSTLNFVEAVNDHRVPVHAIELSLGIDPTNGGRDATALYAASTLSLGAPLSALHTARDYVGRHYLCDISLPWSNYAQHEITKSPLFAEQPVIQLKFPEDE